MGDKPRQLAVKPEWLKKAEHQLAGRIPFHPNVISSIKLLVVTPAMFFSFKQVSILPNSPVWTFLLFVLFCLLDYGVALFFIIGGWQGAVSGLLYSFFTISRLVFFTLNKAVSDPNFFCGVPSTIGGLMVLCALILFDEAIFPSPCC